MMKLTMSIGRSLKSVLAHYHITFTMHSDCLRFCFMHLIQEELNTLSHEWNSHRIRRSKDCSIPAGIPNALFFLPQVQGNHHVQNGCI